MQRRVTLAVVLGVGLFALGGCESPSFKDTETASVQDSEADRAASVPFDRPGLHNVIAMSPKVYSGALPEGDEGFNSLEALGVKTVISVDGAKPEVERAAAHGINYIHIPIQYSGIKPDAARQLAAAVRDLPGPIYVHCHHGKHRGPAAACIALVETGAISSEQGVELMKIAGTSKNYSGLYEVVAKARAIEPGLIDGVAATLPSTAPVPGFVAAMSGLEHASEHLKAIEQAGWKAPADHPDLVAATEAGMLTDYFRAALADSVSESDADDFSAWMQLSVQQSLALEEAIEAGDTARAGAALGVVVQACADCHTKYRNPGKW